MSDNVAVAAASCLLLLLLLPPTYCYCCCYLLPTPPLSHPSCIRDSYTRLQMLFEGAREI
eukprot:1136537-Pelagomonas_calceolata.AAC.4